MGQLVFQANSGGQTNLVGQNTASTFNLNIPLANGTLVSTGDTATVTSAMISGPVTTAKGGTGLTSFTSGGAVYATSTSALTTGTLPTSAGGTNLTSFTSGGVVYASSSSALTTGSALTFDGTNFATTGTVTANGRSKFIGASEPFSIYLRYNSSTNGVYLGSSAADTLNAYDSAGNPFYAFSAASAIFSISGSEQMRLTFTGLGIGTSSPAQKLTVNNTSGATTGGIRVYATDQAYARLAIENLNGQAFHLVAGNPGVSNSGFAIYDATAGATRVQLDSSGNLGLGVTPNANTKFDTNGPIRAGGYTVSTLPTGVVGARAYVTDAVAAVFMAVPSGGGSVKTPVFYNGSNWVCG